MLRSIKSMKGFKIRAKDGNIGEAVDFLFDDERWIIRYLVADTKSLLPGKRVLISPAAFYGTPKWEDKEFPVILTREMVKQCPNVDTAKPVSRKKETELARYYNWPLYWSQWPGTSAPPVFTPKEGPLGEMIPAEEGEGSHLRSAKEVSTYHIHAQDGKIGRVEDIICDDEAWNIRYAVVNTRNWLPGRRVLISPYWIKGVSWAESEIEVDLSREQIKRSPVYDKKASVNRKYEEVLYDYYGRQKYWKEE